MNFVLDASVALLWLAPETNPKGVEYAATALVTLKVAKAMVPSLLALEIANVVAKLESKGVNRMRTRNAISPSLEDSTSSPIRKQRHMPWAIR